MAHRATRHRLGVEGGLRAIGLALALAPLAMPAPAAQDRMASADERAAPDRAVAAFKLTTGLYRYSGGAGGHALDVNLRHTSALGNAWLGYYESAGRDERQWRLGWDQWYEAGPMRIFPSLQAAERGFVGGSLYVEVGRPWFVGAGIGRTNLRPYVNLNFDPNDAWTVAAGRRADDGQTWSATLVRDDREHPDQRHVHLSWRAPLAGGERITADLLYKRGEVDGRMLERWGFSIGYDWPRVFVRVAWDPKANFGPDDMLRLSVGARF